MVDAASPNLITADQLFRMPDDGNRYELVRGRLLRVDPAGSKSSITTGRISRRIGSFVEASDLGLTGDADWGFKLASDPDIVRAPDVAFVKAERIPSDGIPREFWPGPPDLAVEVLSPSDRMVDVLEKVQEYLTAGTRIVWVIDPEARKAIVFHADRPPEVVGSEGELLGEDVIPSFVLRLAEIWV